MKVLESFSSQSYRDFEVCIADDASPDGRQEEIEKALRASGMIFQFKQNETTLRYDANLRAAIGLARGRYCLLMGNDDALAHGHVLAQLKQKILDHSPCGVAIADFEDYATGARSGRIGKTSNYGAGPEVAVAHFRNFSFVSGVVMACGPAQQLATDRWDGSEMYQTYIGCRMIAEGHALLEIAEPMIRKDVRIPGDTVDSYATRQRVRPCPIVERPIPLVRLPALVADAIRPSAANPVLRRRLSSSILQQVVRYTYPFWLVEYRRVQSWNYAVGVAIAMRPRRIAFGVELTPSRWISLYLGYAVATVGGLAVSQALFRRLQPWLYRLAKTVRGLGAA